MITDMYDNPIQKGDFVVFGILSTQISALRPAIVVKIREDKDNIKVFTASKWNRNEVSDRVVIVGTEHMLKIEPHQISKELADKLKDKLDNYQPNTSTDFGQCGACVRRVNLDKAHTCSECLKPFHPVKCFGNYKDEAFFCYKCDPPKEGLMKWIIKNKQQRELMA